MRLLEPQSIHESGNIVSKIFGGIDAFGLVRFTCPSEVQRDAGKVLGVLCHLEGVTSVFGGQIRNENKRLSASLLVIVHHDVVGFDLRHWSLSIRTYSVSLYASKSKKTPRLDRGAQDSIQMVFGLRFDRHWHRFRPRRPAAHFADFKTHEAPDGNIFAQLDDRLTNHLADGHTLVLDVVLFVETVFLVELLHLPVDDFFDDC